MARSGCSIDRIIGAWPPQKLHELVISVVHFLDEAQRHPITLVLSVLRYDGVISYPPGERPMKVLHRMFLGSAIAAAAMSSHAQKTYSLDPGSCGAPNTPLSCLIDVGPPQPPLGEYSWGTFAAGTIAWENNPMGQLGTSTVSDSFCTGTQTYTGTNGQTITACSGMTIVFYGDYLPLYGGASYSGIATINFYYATRYVRYHGWKWVRYVTGGAVRIY